LPDLKYNVQCFLQQVPLTLSLLCSFFPRNRSEDFQQPDFTLLFKSSTQSIPVVFADATRRSAGKSVMKDSLFAFCAAADARILTSASSAKRPEITGAVPSNFALVRLGQHQHTLGQ
jgi:hypothetical protein